MKKALFLAVIVPLLFAQPSEKEDPRAIVEKIRMWRLTQELDLSTEQTAALFPLLHDLRKTDETYNEQKRQILGELKGLLDRKASDAVLNLLLSRYETVTQEKANVHMEMTKKIKTILTPVQQARYLIFEDEFNREIRTMIKEVKKLKDAKR